MLWIVHKSPVGLNAQELIGAFTDYGLAVDACAGVGSYYLSKVYPNRAYRIGTLLDVEVRIVTSVGALSVR